MVPFQGKGISIERDAILAVIPNPHGGEISVGLLSEILKRLDQSRRMVLFL